MPPGPWNVLFGLEADIPLPFSTSVAAFTYQFVEKIGCTENGAVGYTPSGGAVKVQLVVSEYSSSSPLTKNPDIGRVAFEPSNEIVTDSPADRAFVPAGERTTPSRPLYSVTQDAFVL